MPEASVANHVLSIVNSCGDAPGVTTSVHVTTGAGSAVSVAVANPPVLAGFDASSPIKFYIITSPGAVITGGVVSTTSIVLTAEEELPEASVASHVLSIVNCCGDAPGVTTSLNVTTGAGSAVSVAVAEPVADG